MSDPKVISAHIVALEKEALDRWGSGDPSGYLEISAPEVTYFDPFIKKRLNNINELSHRYEPLRGTITIDRYEMLDPLVQIYGDVAILTFNLYSMSGATEMRWNCTEVYRKSDAEWRIVQTHWSITQHLGS